jgi:hypothetical protein
VRGCNSQVPTHLTELGLDQRLIGDPFSTGLLIYRPKGADYLLYSVGPDGKDNGGVPMDGADPAKGGDVGMKWFRKPQKGTAFRRGYRLVPHMNPPVLEPGDPALSN